MEKPCAHPIKAHDLASKRHRKTKATAERPVLLCGSTTTHDGCYTDASSTDGVPERSVVARGLTIVRAGVEANGFNAQPYDT